MIDKQTWYTTKINEKGIEVIDLVMPVREVQKPIPENKNWIVSSTNNDLYPESPVERYDKNMHYMPD
jgi:hypothetical protein